MRRNFTVCLLDDRPTRITPIATKRPSHVTIVTLARPSCPTKSSFSFLFATQRVRNDDPRESQIRPPEEIISRARVSRPMHVSKLHIRQIHMYFESSVSNLKRSGRARKKPETYSWILRILRDRDQGEDQCTYREPADFYEVYVVITACSWLCKRSVRSSELGFLGDSFSRNQPRARHTGVKRSSFNYAGPFFLIVFSFLQRASPQTACPLRLSNEKNEKFPLVRIGIAAAYTPKNPDNACNVRIVREDNNDRNDSWWSR